MTAEKMNAARRLAASHAQIDADVRKIFLLQGEHEDDPSEPIKLLEVVEGTLETGIEPIGFSANPHRGELYPSVIVEISPREFEALGDKLSFAGEHWTIAEPLLPVSA